MILSCIFLAIAAIANAVMDNLTHHFSRSVFGGLKEQFWNPRISWRNKYINGDLKQGRKKIFWKINYPSQISDAWHLFKTIMIFAICGSIILYRIQLGLLYDFCILGTLWNCVFTLFYSGILLKKTN